MIRSSTVLAITLAACGDAGTSAPQLTALATSAPISPPFSPDVHDYTMRCAAGENSLTLALEPPGLTATVVAPAWARVPASGLVTVRVIPDEAVVLEVSGPEQYWIRCLPPDFPAITLTRYPDAGQATPGWYLVGTAVVTAGGGAFAMILDGNGTPVWYRRNDGPVIDVTALGRNTVSFAGLFGPGFGTDPQGKYLIDRLDSGRDDEVGTVGIPTDLHELQAAPDGHLLLLSYPLLRHVDLTGLGSYGADSTIADCAIQEIDPEGEVVWEWRASDHVDPVRESTFPQLAPVDGEAVVDVYHCNSIDRDAAGRLLVSARHLDAVFLIDPDDGRILWKLGGAPFSKGGAKLVTVAGGEDAAFFRQHDARLLPGGGISLFDDRTDVSGVARGVEYALDLDAGTAAITRQFPGSVSSRAMGSYRHYADGSCLVGWGAPGPGSTLAASEFTESGARLLDLSLGGNATYRALKVSPATFDADVLRKAVLAANAQPPSE